MISEPSRAAPRYLSDLFRNGTPAALSDAELLNRFASRRSEHDETAELAFAALLARHGPMVLRVCRAVLGDRHEVEDAFQATFLVLAVRARSIRRRGSVASWLHGVALRVAASERSRAARRRRHELVAGRNDFIHNRDVGERSGVRPRADPRHPGGDRPPAREIPGGGRALLSRRPDPRDGRRTPWLAGGVGEEPVGLGARATSRAVDPAGRRPDDSVLRPIPSSRDAESAPIPVLLGTRLVDATLRGALKAGMGSGALVGIVSAEAVALVEGIIKSMTNAKLMLVMAAVLIAGLVTAGAGVMGYSAIRQEKPAIARDRRPGTSPTGCGLSGHAGPAPCRCRETGHGSRSAHPPGRSRRSGGSPSVRGRCRRDGLVCAQLREHRNRSSSEPRPTAPARCSSKSLANARGRRSTLRTSGRTNPGVRLR